MVRLKSAGPTSISGGIVLVSGDVITYMPPMNFAGTDTFNYVVEDNGKTAGTNDFKTTTGTVTINVTSENDPPVIAFSGTEAVVEDAGLLLTDLTVTDVDAGPSAIAVSFAATNGIVTLGRTNGLTFTAGTNGASQITVLGTQADFANAMTNVTFRGSLNFYGNAWLRITADDLGNSGAGGPMTDTKLIEINISPLNDPPMVTLVSPTNNASYSASETIVLEANASDIDGQIVSVEFFEGNNRITTLSNSPYQHAWTNAPLLSYATNYNIYAKATDNLGLTACSDTNLITVRPPGLFKLTNPQVLAARFALVITGEVGQKYSIDTSTNLQDWTSFTTITNSDGAVTFEGGLTGGVDHLFYRARLVR